jgi:hypothetical protein
VECPRHADIGDDVELPVDWTMPLIEVFILNALPLRASTPFD